MRNISVLLVDDHPVVRQGLAALLAVEPDIEIVGEAGDGEQAIALARTKKPSVVIMDLAMPQLNGVQATRRIVQEVPSAKVLVLTSYTHDEYVREAIEAGASGFLLKHAAAQDLIRAIREVHSGNAFFSPAIAKRLRDQSRQALGGRSSHNPSALTLREIQVLQLIAEGFPNKRISAELGISTKTVEKHRQHLMNKLGIHETAGLTRYVLSHKSLEASSPTQPAGSEERHPGEHPMRD